MHYVDAVRYLYGLESRGVRLGLGRIRRALARRGNPERDLIVVHVAGTNGKGSVSSMIATVLSGAGYRTGLFTSPHMHRFVERIRVDGRPIGEADLARRVDELKRETGSGRLPRLSFFETATVLALEKFRDARCDVVVLEVGLGGRLDATNVIERPIATVITGISLEHQNVLGDTIAEIAREEAGIIKPGVPIVTGARARSARRVIAARARRLAAPLLAIDRDFRAVPTARGRFDVEVRGATHRDLRLALAGVHQLDNAACAAATLSTLTLPKGPLSSATITRGLARTRWPGRLERIAGQPSILLDAAHNAEGCRRLAHHLSELPRAGKRVLVFAAMRDKNHEQMLGALLPQVDRVIYCAPAMARATPPRDLKRHAPGAIARSVVAAVGQAQTSAGEGGLVVVAGSIFAVADARAHLLGVRAEPHIGM
jgi:dihydrofolate synthase/folylpolyglutamate synthase